MTRPSRSSGRPTTTEELDDLLALHERAGIELRVVPDLAAVWVQVAESTLEFSGIRLRNLER